MESILSSIQLSFTQMLGWELVAVILALAYLLLIMRECIWGWHCAFVSTAIYTMLFWKVSLLMDSMLNVYFMLMAVYGWWQWRNKDITSVKTKTPNTETNVLSSDSTRIRTWRWPVHLITALVIVVLTLVSGYLLSENTRAAWPYLDSFTTWASVVTTYMVAKKVLENWLYWILIDAVALCLYVERGLYLTALLFIAYLVICVFGYLNWKKTYRGYQPVAD